MKLENLLKNLKPHEILFLFAGVGVILSLPFIQSAGIYLWFLAKISYFAGIIFFVLKERA